MRTVGLERHGARRAHILGAAAEVFAELELGYDAAAKAAALARIGRSEPSAALDEVIDLLAADVDPGRAARWVVGLINGAYLMSVEAGFDPVADAAELRRLIHRHLGTRA